MRLFRLRLCFHLPFLLVAFYLHRKLRISSSAQEFLLREIHSTATNDFKFASSESLNKALQSIPSPAVLLLNKHALNITLNFLCNVAAYEGVHERLLIFAFDAYSYETLQQLFPHVKSIRWRMSALEEKFSMGDGRYQLFQYFRAKLAAYLAKRIAGEGLWMVQADTIWQENLFSAVDFSSPEYRHADVIFDREGEVGLLASMVAGGYFYIRAQTHWPNSTMFFTAIATHLKEHYATDNNVMTRHCLIGTAGTRCAFFPHTLIANWRYAGAEDVDSGPALFQYDGGDDSQTKLGLMSQNDLLFFDFNSMESTSGEAKHHCFASSGNSRKGSWKRDSHTRKDKLLIRTVHSYFELLAKNIPQLKYLILSQLFPRYAYYLAI